MNALHLIWRAPVVMVCLFAVCAVVGIFAGVTRGAYK